ncbi:MAG: hypothetical protein OQJ97_12980 [Rhodospirillales bacterium]|nr:hypothetical protein [Rhodospirillales bacterium]
MRFIAILLLTFFVSGQAQAYSYAAAGKEPLIDAREAIFKAINDSDYGAAQTALDTVAKEIDYLDTNLDKGIKQNLSDAISAKDAKAVSAALHRVFAAEISHRLSAGAKHLDDYQLAKVLVVKSKRFFDSMAGNLSGVQREAAEKGLRQCLVAIGNPGVFGVGQKPADPEAYQKAMSAVLAALGK